MSIEKSENKNRYHESFLTVEKWKLKQILWNMVVNWKKMKVKTHCTKTVEKSECENRYHESCFHNWKVKVKTDIVKHGGQLKSEN